MHNFIDKVRKIMIYVNKVLQCTRVYFCLIFITGLVIL